MPEKGEKKVLLCFAGFMINYIHIIYINLWVAECV